MNHIKIETTKDGSHTICHPIYKVLYHSSNGAIIESDVIYINNGLFYCIQQMQLKEVSILEMGFGSGLNAFNTFVKSNNMQVSIQYTALEKYPLELQFINGLNYKELLASKNKDNIFHKMHAVKWGEMAAISPTFKLLKKQQDFLDFKEKNCFDLIYFDAFSPDDQPELWSEALFLNMYKALKPNGVLVTYSSKGIVKRALRNVGFIVKRLQGPPGKHHVLRALKICK